MGGAPANLGVRRHLQRRRRTPASGGEGGTGGGLAARGSGEVRNGLGAERRVVLHESGGNGTHAGRCETSSRIAPLPRNRPECFGVDIPPRPVSSRPVPVRSAGSCDIRATWRGPWAAQVERSRTGALSGSVSALRGPGENPPGSHRRQPLGLPAEHVPLRRASRHSPIERRYLPAEMKRGPTPKTNMRPGSDRPFLKSKI
jgi:hypothetical protein